jgi:hypothetical protein
MSKIELYLVKSSSGSYDDYRESNETIIYATLEAAEKRKQEIIDSHKEKPFPFDWCTEQEFDELRGSNIILALDDKITDEQWTIYDQWDSDNYNAREFGSAWIQTIELDLQSWRERQLGNLGQK